MASLGELFIELGVLGDDEGAQKVAKSIDKVIEKAQKAVKQLNEQNKATGKVNKSSITAAAKMANWAAAIGGIITAVSGAVIALNKLTDSLVTQNQHWINLTRNTTTALSTYQKWGMVGAALDKSLGMEGAAGAVKALNDQIFEYKLTGQGAEGFLFAGIMPTNADDVLEQLRARVSGMNDDAASYLLRKMGIDERMLSVLRLSKKEFEELNAEMAKYQLTPEQRASIQEFHRQMSIVNVKMQYFKDRIIIKILPHFLNFMRNIEFVTEKLFDFAKAVNKLTGKFKPLIIIALGFIAKIKPIAKFLVSMNKAFGGLIAKIPIFGRLIAGLGGILGRAFLPLTAIYLLIDDVRAFLSGGRSVIGVIITLFQKLANKINFEAPEWLKDLVYIIGKSDNLVAAIGAAKSVANGEDIKVNAFDVGNTALGLLNPGMFLSNAIAGAAASVINNNQNQSKNISQTISIYTNQTAKAVNNELTQAGSVFG